MKTAYDIIKRPIITEKSMEAVGDKKYVFEVATDANKVEIRKAVEEIFGVKVMSVNTINVPGKITRGRTDKPGKKADRKTVVTLVALAMFVISIPICCDKFGFDGENGVFWPLYSYLADGSKDLLDFYDMLTEGLMMPLGAMLMCIVIGWKTGFGWMKDEVLQDGKVWKMEKFFRVCVKDVTPILMCLVLVSLFLSYLGL